MGGVNCPPPRRDGIPSGLEKHYVSALATYSNSLFGGVATFFSAQAEIEKAVLAQGSIITAAELLEHSSSMLDDARRQLGTVAAHWVQIAPNQPVEFIDQLSLLSEAGQAVQTARMELELLEDGPSLQDQLWSDSTLTANFIAATQAIGRATTWQMEFAASTALVTTS